MPVFLSAQVLPAHIIEEIASYVCARQNLSYLWGYPKQLDIPTMLIPFLGLCKRWRYVVSSILFRSAQLCMDGQTTRGFTDERVLNIKKAIEIECQHHIRHIHMFIDINNLCEQWDTSSSNYASILYKCGSMPAVQSMFAYLTLANDSEHYNRIIGEEPIDDIMQNISRNIVTFAKAMDEILPFANRVEVLSIITNRSDADRRKVQIANKVFSAINRHTKKITLVGWGYTEQLLSNLSDDRLESIKLNIGPLTEAQTALIRRNSNSLEQLYIYGTEVTPVFDIIVDKHLGCSIRIYPRLRHLNIISCNENENISLLPEVDPFPQLETLECRGQFPFKLTEVLKQGRSHIRTLIIDLDESFVELLIKDKILVKNAFARLQSISLGVKYNSHLSTFTSTLLIARVFKLCEFTRKIGFPNIHFDSIALEISNVKVSQSLRYLDIRSTPLTIDEAIEVLCACPRLLGADIFFRKDPEISEEALPSKDLLQYYQGKYSGHTFSVERLNLTQIKFSNSQQASEFVLFLVAIVSSITKVCLTRRYLSNRALLINCIGIARSGSWYANLTRLDSVSFFNEI